MKKPLLSLSLDLDNLWSYMKTHGDPGWESFPSYLEPLVEIVLDRLDRHGLKITFFVVGQDAALQKNEAAIRALAAAGHELGNHSFHHEPWLHEYSPAEIDAEIAGAEQHIERVAGVRPRGFRGPGFSFSPDTLAALARRGYLYDASTFPTFLGPLARAYYFWKSRGLTAEDLKKRKRLFGGLGEGFRPLRPYCWRSGDLRLLEIPVTTMPVFRAPIHLSYLLYLARRSRRLAGAYLRAALGLCRLSGVEPSFLLHPLDVLGCDRVAELSFFPGMDLTTDFKLKFFDGVVEHFKKRFRVVTMEEHARSVTPKAEVTVRRVGTTENTEDTEDGGRVHGSPAAGVDQGTQARPTSRAT